MTREFNVPCFDPANGTTVTIKTAGFVPVHISPSLIRPRGAKRRHSELDSSFASSSGLNILKPADEATEMAQQPLKYFKGAEPSPVDKALLSGVILVKDNQVCLDTFLLQAALRQASLSAFRLQTIEVVDAEEAVERLAVPRHTLKFSSVRSFPAFISVEALLDELYASLSK